MFAKTFESETFHKVRWRRRIFCRLHQQSGDNGREGETQNHCQHDFFESAIVTAAQDCHDDEGRNHRSPRTVDDGQHEP